MPSPPIAGGNPRPGGRCSMPPCSGVSAPPAIPAGVPVLDPATPVRRVVPVLLAGVARAPVRPALRFADARFAGRRLAAVRLAGLRLAVLRLAAARLAGRRLAVVRLAVARFAVLRFAVLRLAVERLAVLRFAVLRPELRVPDLFCGVAICLLLREVRFRGN